MKLGKTPYRRLELAFKCMLKCGYLIYESARS